MEKKMKIVGVTLKEAGYVFLNLLDADKTEQEIRLDEKVFSLNFVPQTLSDLANLNQMSPLEAFFFKESSKNFSNLKIMYEQTKAYALSNSLEEFLNDTDVATNLFESIKNKKSLLEVYELCSEVLNLEIISTLEYLLMWRHSKMDAISKIFLGKYLLIKDFNLVEFLLQ